MAKTAKIEKEKTHKTKPAAKKEKEKAVVEAAPKVEAVPKIEAVPKAVEIPEETKTEGKIKEVEYKEEKPGKYYEAVGRRKSAVARVRLYTKGSEIVINGRPHQNYFATLELQQIIEAPFKKMKNLGKFKTDARVKGGGLKGQAEAIRHGISRALVKFNADFRKRLKKAGFLTRDARVKERKKYGLKGARKAPQWQKR